MENGNQKQVRRRGPFDSACLSTFIVFSIIMAFVMVVVIVAPPARPRASNLGEALAIPIASGIEHMLAIAMAAAVWGVGVIVLGLLAPFTHGRKVPVGERESTDERPTQAEMTTGPAGNDPRMAGK